MINAPYLSLSHIRWLVICFSAAILPYSLYFPYWVTAFALACIVWRLMQSHRGGAIPHATIRILLVAIGVTCILLQFNTLISKDAGVSFLILMLALKLLEIKARRDVLFFIFLNYFVVMANFFYSQSLWLASYMLIMVWLNTAVLSYSNRRNSESIHQYDLRLSLRLLLQASPLFIVFFILFPRFEGPFLKLPGDNNAAKTGLSDRMRPGDISQLIRSHEIAFRAEFEAAAPDKRHLYWRGPVLSVYDGSTWTRDKTASHTLSPPSHSGSATIYKIILEPTGTLFLPTLEYPVNAPADAWIDHEYVSFSRTPVNTRITYILYSRQSLGNTSSGQQDLGKYKLLPIGTNPRTQKLISALRGNSVSDKELVNKVLAYFKTENFVYTLTPPLLGQHAVDDFLFNSKRGFCEHYANAFVFIMRHAGIPARVVTGYQGGEYNPVGNYYIVRQSDAHAWSEIWLDNSGWVRVDPTAQIAPERVELGINASLPQLQRWHSNGFESSSWIRQIVYRWDNLNNSWNQLVLGYSHSAQSKFFSNIGLAKLTPLTIAFVLIVVVTLIVVGFAYIQYRKLSHVRTSELDILFAAFCKELGKTGVVRYSWEGASAYCQRLLDSFSQYTADTVANIKTIMELYSKIKYSDETDQGSLSALRLLINNFRPGLLS